MRKIAIHPHTAIYFTTIRYTENPLWEHQPIIEEAFRKGLTLYLRAIDVAPSLQITHAVAKNGSVLPSSKLLSTPLEDLRYGLYGLRELRITQARLFSPYCVWYTGTALLLNNPHLALTPRRYCEEAIAANSFPSQECNLGHFPGQPSYVGGGNPRNVGDLKTTMFTFAINAEHVQALFRYFTNSPRHKSAMESVRGVAYRGDGLDMVSGTFAYVPNPEEGPTLAGMKRALERMWKQEGQSTATAFHFREFFKFYEVGG